MGAEAVVQKVNGPQAQPRPLLMANEITHLDQLQIAVTGPKFSSQASIVAVAGIPSIVDSIVRLYHLYNLVSPITMLKTLKQIIDSFH